MDEFSKRRYVLITPCRNEAEHIERTVRSIRDQSISPGLWVLVDDGSTDGTAEIVLRAGRGADFIKVVRRPDRGSRAVGPGVMEAFYAGLREVNLDEYDYLCKLDGDLELPPRYFEGLMREMERKPFVGNLSGKTYIRSSDGGWVSERMGDENAVGPAKFYRVQCFRDIGGFVRELAWDGIDGHMCRMAGWVAMSVDRPDLRIKHLRPQGSSYKSIWVGRKRWGRGKYYMGASAPYVLAAAVYRLFEYPYLVGGLGILFGYLEAARSSASKYSNSEYRRFLRVFELLSLLIGKGRTIRLYNKRIIKKANTRAAVRQSAVPADTNFHHGGTE